MSWRTVTEDDLISALSAKEVDAYRRGAASDPIEPLLASEVAYVRGVIRTSPARVKMDPDESTLPESLILPAMDHLRFTVLMRMNVEANDSRTKAYENAVHLFRDVRSGQFSVESAESETASSDVAGSPASGTVRPHRLLD